MTRSPPGRQGSGPMPSRNSVLATSNSERKSRRSSYTPTTRARFWRSRPSRSATSLMTERLSAGASGRIASVLRSVRVAWARFIVPTINSSDATSPSRSCRARSRGIFDLLARFVREARLLATLNHPHVGADHGIEQSEAGPRRW